ncbi:MAG: phosphoribosylformylglycinamidine synthase subunit PurQ [Bacillota bacterium]
MMIINKKKAVTKNSTSGGEKYSLLSRVTDMATLCASDFPHIASGLHQYITKSILAQLKEYYSTIKKAPTMLELLIVGAIWSEYKYEDMAISQIELESSNPHIRKALDLYRACRMSRPSKAPTTIRDISVAGQDVLALMRADIYRTVGRDTYFAFDAGNRIEKGKNWLSVSSSLIRQERGQTAIRKIADACRLKHGKPLMFSRVEVAKNNEKIAEHSRYFAEYGSKEGVPSYNDTGIYSERFNESYEIAVSINLHKTLHDNAVRAGDRIVLIMAKDNSADVINSDDFEKVNDNLVNYTECESNLMQSCLDFESGVRIVLDKKNGYQLENILNISEGSVLAAVRSKEFKKFEENIASTSLVFDAIGIAEIHRNLIIMQDKTQVFSCNINTLKYRKQLYTTAIVRDREYFYQREAEVPEDITEYVLSRIKKAKISSNLIMDGTSGASIFAPLGGKMLLTPTAVNGVIAPIKDDRNRAVVYAVGNTSTNRQYPFLTSINAIVYAISKLIAAGVPLASIATNMNGLTGKISDAYALGDYLECRLGELYCMTNLAVANLGGAAIYCRGSGAHQNVSTTAVGVAPAGALISNVFKPNQKLYYLRIKRDKYGVPDFKYLLRLYNLINICISTGNIESATAVKGNITDALTVSLIGSGAGFSFAKIDESTFESNIGDFIVSANNIEELISIDYEYLGVVDDTGDIKGAGLSISNRNVFKALFGSDSNKIEQIDILPYIDAGDLVKPKISTVKPRVVIPYFNHATKFFATNFERAGAEVSIARVDLSASEDELAREMRKYIENSQIVGLYAPSIIGDSGTLGARIARLIEHPIVFDAVNELIYRRDGIILGLSEGMRVLTELGLIPNCNKNIKEIHMVANNPQGFASNTCKVKVISNKGPWFSGVELGKIYSVDVGVSMGRIAGKEEYLKELLWQGQIPTVFVDSNGEPTMQYPFNPTGSMFGVESVMSPDGRVLGRLSYGDRLVTRVNGVESFDEKLLERGVKYFK